MQRLLILLDRTFSLQFVHEKEKPIVQEHSAAVKTKKTDKPLVSIFGRMVSAVFIRVEYSTFKKSSLALMLGFALITCNFLNAQLPVKKIHLASTGEFVSSNCSQLDIDKINQAMSILIELETSGFERFQQVLDTAPLVEYECSRRDRISREIGEAIRANKITVIYCYDARENVAAEAEIDITGEEMYIDYDFINRVSARRVASVIAHELMHNRGFRHTKHPLRSQYYPNTVPEQVEAIVLNGAPNPAEGALALNLCTSYDRGGDALAVGDIDGDGTTEVLVAEDNGGVVEIYSSGGVLKRSINTYFDRGGDDMAVGDIDGDGKADIIIAEDDNGAIDIYSETGIRKMTWARGASCHSGFDKGGDAIAAGDINNDGKAEIFVAEDNGGRVVPFTVEIRDQYEVCLRAESPINTSFDSGDALAVADMNNDGIAEILVAEDSGGLVQIYDRYGRVLGSVRTSYDSGDDIAAGDIDGDGRTEILVAEDNGGKVEAYWWSQR